MNCINYLSNTNPERVQLQIKKFTPSKGPIRENNAEIPMVLSLAS